MKVCGCVCGRVCEDVHSHLLHTPAHLHIPSHTPMLHVSTHLHTQIIIIPLLAFGREPRVWEVGHTHTHTPTHTHTHTQTPTHTHRHLRTHTDTYAHTTNPLRHPPVLAHFLVTGPIISSLSIHVITTYLIYKCIIILVIVILYAINY